MADTQMMPNKCLLKLLRYLAGSLASGERGVWERGRRRKEKRDRETDRDGERQRQTHTQRDA